MKTKGQNANLLAIRTNKIGHSTKTLQSKYKTRNTRRIQTVEGKQRKNDEPLL